MKIAFVIGFFEPVRKALRADYPDENYRNRLIWIESGKGALTVFKERFYDVVKTADGVFVCLGRPGSRPDIERNVRGIIEVAESQHPTQIQLMVTGNLYDSAPVMEAVRAFNLDEPLKIGIQHIRAKITVGKILCVSPQGKTSILAALDRAHFSEEAIGECFEEEIQEYGKNSNLMQYLKGCGGSYSCLLYAWEGLRTSDQDVKDAYQYGCHEANSASQVVDLFKKWLMEGG